jgi:ethanolamine utilization protein EutA
MNHLGFDYQIGDQIKAEDKKKIAQQFIDILIEALSGQVKSPLGQQLMLTPDPYFPRDIDEFSFSGGVAELMYGAVNNYGDIGHLLADELNLRLPQLRVPVVEPASKIRATVIGAGAYSLSISGCSGFMDDKIEFPIRNVPVLRVDVEQTRLSPEHVAAEINFAFRRFDFKEGEDVVALYFEDPVQASYPRMELFSKSIEAALPNSIRNKLPIILIFNTDIACGVGNVMRRETNLKNNLLSMDELSLKEGDWIDIGEPLVDGQVFPVTVKSLVFYDS